VVSSASTTFYVGAHATVPGTVAADPYGVALSAAEDLARCLRYLYRWNSPGSGYMLAVGQAVSATSVYIPFPLPVEMAVNPAFTVSSYADFAVYSATGSPQTLTSLSLSSQNPVRMGMLGGVAANLVAGNACIMVALNATGWLQLEANP
jgi:hypothetical protein